jgi:hypothetical protein
MPFPCQKGSTAPGLAVEQPREAQRVVVEVQRTLVRRVALRRVPAPELVPIRQVDLGVLCEPGAQRGGSVRAWWTSWSGAATRVRSFISSLTALSLGVAGDGELAGITFGAAVAGEQVQQRGLEVVQEFLALLRADPDLTGDSDPRLLGRGPVESPMST